MAVRARISGLRGRGPVSSTPFPFPTAVEVLVREQAVDTITEPAGDRAPTLGTMRTTATGRGTETVAGLAAVPVAGTVPVRVTRTGEEGPGTVAAPDPTTITTATRTATVTVMARPPLCPSTCGRSSGRF